MMDGDRGRHSSPGWQNKLQFAALSKVLFETMMVNKTPSRLRRAAASTNPEPFQLNRSEGDRHEEVPARYRL